MNFIQVVVPKGWTLVRLLVGYNLRPQNLPKNEAIWKNYPNARNEKRHGVYEMPCVAAVLLSDLVRQIRIWDVNCLN